VVITTGWGMGRGANDYPVNSPVAVWFKHRV